MQVIIISEMAEAARELGDWLRERWPECEVAVVPNLDKETDSRLLAILDLIIIGCNQTNLVDIMLCRHIRRVTDTPVIALSNMTDSLQMVQAMDAGVDQCLPWSCSKSVFLAYAGTLLRRSQVGFDSLTSFYNMRHFDSLMATELERARRFRYPLSLLRLEIQSLQSLEQAQGNGVADLVIGAVAGVLRKSVRSSDTLFRYGMSRFLLVLPLTDRPGVEVVRSRVEQRIENLRKEDGWSQETIGIKVDCHTFEPNTEADIGAALKQAKS